MITIGNLLDACGISYTDKQLVKLDKLVNELLKTLRLQQSNETTKHDSIPDSRNEDFERETELKPFQHSTQEFVIEPEQSRTKEKKAKEILLEIKKEFPKDPFVSLETLNNSKVISDMVKEENIETKGQLVSKYPFGVSKSTKKQTKFSL